MKRVLGILLLAVMCVTAATSCCGLSRVKDIRVTSLDMKYITPTSTRSMEAVLLIGINNPAMSFKVSGIEGSVKYGPRDIVVVKAGEILLEKKSEKVYELPCSASLAEGVSLLTLLPILADGSGANLTANVKLRVALKNGLGTDLEFNDLAITRFTR